MPMPWYDYMIITIDIIPQYIIDEYQLINKVKMASTCVKSNEECTYLHIKEWLKTNYSQIGF